MKDENNLFVVARVKWNPNKQTAIKCNYYALHGKTWNEN